MSDNASATAESAELTERVRLALESGDLDAIRDLLDPGACWGALRGDRIVDIRGFGDLAAAAACAGVPR